MTILGKVLLFFVLVLSLVWAGLTVNVFVTRTNWMTTAAKWQDKAKEAQSSSEYQRKLAEEIRNASAAKTANMQREIDQLRAQIDQLSKDSAAAKQQLNDKITAQQVAIPPDQLLQANIARLQKQLDILQGSLATMEGQLNTATIAAEKSKADALKAQIDRDAALKARDDLEYRFLQLSDQFTEFRTGRSQSARIAPPDDFRATVTEVQGDLLGISLGLNAKLQKGAVLSVWRAEKYLGSVTITNIDPYSAVGRFMPPTGKKPTGDDLPKKGDTVGVLKP